MSAVALYYPFIQIPDDDWLRSSLLIWDKIAAIVPRGTEHIAGDLAIRLREADFVQFVDPMDHYGKLSNRRFKRGFKRVLKSKEVKSFLDSDVEGGVTHMHFDSFGVRIHSNKVSTPLMSYLEKHHGAIRDREWIRCDPKLADLYMTYLACQLSGPTRSSILTNVAALDGLRSAVAQDLTEFDHRDAQYTLTADLQAELPQVPPDYPIEKLIALKLSHQREYDSFRNRILNLREGLRHAEDETTTERQLDDFRVRMHQAIDDLHRVARKHRWDLVATSLKTTFAVAAVVAGLVLTKDAGTIVGLSGMGAGIAIDYGSELRRVRLEKQQALYDSDFAYLYLLKKEL